MVCIMIEYSDATKAKIKKHRDFEAYKSRMEYKLNKLQEAFYALIEEFQDEDFDCNDYICDDYPFEESFDEISISEWIESTCENLEHKRSQLEDEMYEVMKKEAKTK